LPNRNGFAATTMVRVQAAHALLGLAVEPTLRDEYREQAEHDGECDHHDGAFAHGPDPGLTRYCCVVARTIASAWCGIGEANRAIPAMLKID
jgi:hypothetical protein